MLRFVPARRQWSWDRREFQRARLFGRGWSGKVEARGSAASRGGGDARRNPAWASGRFRRVAAPGSLVSSSPDPLAWLAAQPEVAAAVGSSRAGVDRALRHRVVRQRGGEVSAEGGLRDARASAALAGAQMSLEDLRSRLDGPASGVGGLPAVLAGALRVAAAFGVLAPVVSSAPRQVLARLHVLAAYDLAGPEDLGRPRRDGSPPPEQVAARLDLLSELLAGSTEVPAVVLAAVAHAEVLMLRPFGTADDVVARALARLVMIARGLDPRAVTVPDVGHLELAGAYRLALDGYANGDAVGWVCHCALALELGARETLAICEALDR